MSRFLSPKYLSYRKALTGAVIDRDLPCRSCGYNLRGLRFGRPCPECGEAAALPGFEAEPSPPPPPKPGTPIDEDLACAACGYNLRGLKYGSDCPECGAMVHAIRPLHDLMLDASPVERHRYQVGLALAALCIAVATGARIAYFLAAARGSTRLLDFGYIGIGAVNAVTWIVAVWLITPSGLQRRWPVLSAPRRIARGLALLWIPGYAGLVLYHLNPTALGAALVVDIANYGGRFGGGVGALFVAFILSWIAEEAELPTVARRLNAAVWILWFPTLLAQAFPIAIAWFTLIPLGLVLFFWAWLMILMGLGAHALSRHARWSEVHALSSRNRADRIAEKRRQMAEAIEKTIRPLPELADDEVSLRDEEG